MPNTILAPLITLYSIALHGRKSHYKNAEEKNNTRLKSLKVIEAMYCDSIKRTLQRRKGNRVKSMAVEKEDRDGEKVARYTSMFWWQSSHTGVIMDRQNERPLL